MLTLIRTNSNNPDFQKLAAMLESELKIRDAEEHALYGHLNTIGFMNNVIVAYLNEQAIGCGAIRHFDDEVIEIKRMYTLASSRGSGIASGIITRLEDWARELGYKKCVLETGLNQPVAIAFYKKHGYVNIPKFGKYIDSGNSICFEKTLTT